MTCMLCPRDMGLEGGLAVGGPVAFLGRPLASVNMAHSLI